MAPSSARGFVLSAIRKVSPQRAYNLYKSRK
jgi:hypothetical protein